MKIRIEFVKSGGNIGTTIEVKLIFEVEFVFILQFELHLFHLKDSSGMNELIIFFHEGFNDIVLEWDPFFKEIF